MSTAITIGVLALVFMLVVEFSVVLEVRHLVVHTGGGCREFHMFANLDD